MQATATDLRRPFWEKQTREVAMRVVFAAIEQTAELSEQRNGWRSSTPNTKSSSAKSRRHSNSYLW
jgi:hypothetical protein